MRNDPNKLLLAEVVLFRFGAGSVWYSFSRKGRACTRKAGLQRHSARSVWDLFAGWFAPDRLDVQMRVYRIVAWVIAAFSWSLVPFLHIRHAEVRIGHTWKAGKAAQKAVFLAPWSSILATS
jgi:hypothetical protein